MSSSRRQLLPPSHLDSGVIKRVSYLASPHSLSLESPFSRTKKGDLEEALGYYHSFITHSKNPSFLEIMSHPKVMIKLQKSHTTTPNHPDVVNRKSIAIRI